MSMVNSFLSINIKFKANLENQFYYFISLFFIYIYVQKVTITNVKS